jgi:hypothetical protein
MRPDVAAVMSVAKKHTGALRSWAEIGGRISLSLKSAQRPMGFGAAGVLADLSSIYLDRQSNMATRDRALAERGFWNLPYLIAGAIIPNHMSSA